MFGKIATVLIFLVVTAVAVSLGVPAQAGSEEKPGGALPAVGSKAPDFKLRADDGKIYTLSSQKGRWVVLAFYPADMTPGCTLEVRSLRDAMPQIKALGAVVFGISVQDVDSHKRFCEAEKLNFRLLADDRREVARKYGVLTDPNGVAKRVTFFIDPKGVIRKIDSSVKVATHGSDVAAALKELAGRK